MPGNYEARGDRRQAAAAPSTWCLILCRATMKLGATAGKPRPPPRLGASKRKSYKNPMKFPALALLLPFLLTSPVLAQEAALPLEPPRSEEHTSELQSLMRISYAVFCLKHKLNTTSSLNIHHY